MEHRAQIPAAAFREELDEIELKRRELREQDQRLARRADWLRQGLEYEDGPGGEGSVQEVVPPPAVFASGKTRPTIRQAIVLAMLAFPPERVWRPAEVIEELDRRGWLPAAKSSHQMIRNRMLSMVERGELLKRDPGGFYKLADDIRNTGLMPVEPEDS
ncbi:MAG TPA: hypothetical protein VH061_04815 [Solirubrobacteraceae bacterium]|jgi:hypothetical protein|nr:hypothetical protein [Solirubrobacteraceae bacterium]